MKKTKLLPVVAYGLLSHHLKSPLASIKSLHFILDRRLAAENITVYKPTLASLEQKINILNTRITQVMEYLRLKESTPELMYEFFPLQESLDAAVLSLGRDKQRRIRIENKLAFEVMGDKALWQLAFQGILQSVLQSGTSLSIRGSFEKGTVTIVFTHTPTVEEGSSEQGVESALLFAIANLVVLHQGGEAIESEKQRRRELRVTIPIKPLMRK